MKYIYLLITLLCFNTSFSQNELLGSWYLNETNIDGTITYNADFDQYHPFIEFTNTNGLEGLEYSGNVCNEHYGDYSVDTDNNTLHFFSRTQTFAFCSGNNEDLFEANYFGNIVNSSANLSYSITGTGNLAVLQIMNIDNSNYATYGRTPQYTEVLDDWYLYSINVNNVDSYNQELGVDYPNLRFITVNGSSSIEGVVCNGYFGNCIINTSTIEITGVGSLNGACNSDAIQQFEESYFNILDGTGSIPNVLDYQITGTGLDQTLLLTDQTSSNYAVFGRRSQPTDVLGDWYLYSTTVEGLDLYNAEFGEGQPRIAFKNTNGFIGLQYDGLSCNDFLGEYIFNTDGTITKIDFSTTLNECDNTNTDDFKFSYINNVLNVAEDATFSYQITGTGDEQTMVLTNTDNSNYATFGRTQQTPEVAGIWFLHYLVIDSNQVNNPSSEVPTIEFYSTPFSNGTLGFFGFAICTGYGGDYHYNPQQTLDMDYLVTTQGNPCDTVEENLFESDYFNFVLGTDDSTEFDYKIIGTGDNTTLVVTNLSNGNQAVYGRQALSVDDNTFGSSKISLNNNPVANTLKFSTTQDLANSNYEIYSITGKLIVNGYLKSNTIDVSSLNSGLYFLKVSNETNRFKTVKFIKE